MLKIKSFLLFFFFSLVLFLQFTTSCNTTEPPSNQTLTLKLADVSCTEAWLQLTTSNLQLPAAINILKNNSVTQTFSLSTQDSLLYIDSLMPNQSYKFKVVINTTNNPQPTTNEVLAQTMDTTSHNFTWQTFTFGDAGAGSSTLYDVAIIDENNIWAVGEIYMNDSLGNPDPNAYNAVHWDGQKWELKKIKTNACGGVDYPPVKAIFAFSADDILFSHIDGSITHYDGTRFTNDCSLITQLNGSANKIWGISKNDFYVVSGNGFIAHYKNGSWTKIESGTTTSIKDIWGKVNPVTQNKIIYCAVSNVVTSGDYKILSIRENNSIDSISWNTGRRVESIWFEDNLKIFTCGGGVFINNGGNLWKEQTDLPLIHTNRIRGQGKNDVFVGGDFGLLADFNGVSWHVYTEANVALFYSLDYKSSALIAVGERNGKAVILKGKK